MQSTVIGGAMLPHAPQFFTMPDTEDKALVAHVREIAADTAFPNAWQRGIVGCGGRYALTNTGRIGPATPMWVRGIPSA